MLQEEDYNLLQYILDGFQPLARERFRAAYLIARGLVEEGEDSKVHLTLKGRQAIGKDGRGDGSQG